MKKQAFLLLPHPQTFPNALDTSHSVLVLGHPKILAAIFSLGKGGGREAHPPALFSLHPFQRSFKTGADQKDHNRDVENRKRLVWEGNHQQKIGEKNAKKVCATLHLFQKVHFLFSTLLALSLNTTKYCLIKPTRV